MGVLLFVEPHGAGKQWRWLLTCRLLSVAVSRGRFNDLIAQVRFSSEFLWSQECTGDALYRVHDFLMSIFGESIHLQVSEIHLCADVVGYDFSQCDYETLFVTLIRKNEALFGVDSVSLNCHRVATLAFSKHKAPLSCAIYNKSLELAFRNLKSELAILSLRVYDWEGRLKKFRKLAFPFRQSSRKMKKDELIVDKLVLFHFPG